MRARNRGTGEEVYWQIEATTSPGNGYYVFSHGLDVLGGMVSTSARGDAFEARVFDQVKEAMEAEQLGLSSKYGRLFRRKGYHSRDRGQDIIVDISIEVWPPGATKWSLLWVCECKDYSGSVPVSDVEEFKAKLNQIAGVNCKGVIAISGPMQSSALNYAQANGIGVIRLLPDDQVHYIAYSMSMAQYDRYMKRRAKEFLKALTERSYVSDSQNFYALKGKQIFDDWESLLTRMLRVPRSRA